MTNVLQGRLQTARQFVNADKTKLPSVDPTKPESSAESPEEQLPDQQFVDNVDPSPEDQPSPVLEVRSPVPSNTIHWPRYTANEERYIVFGDGQSITTSSGLKHKECMYWGRLYPDLKKATGNTLRNDIIQGVVQ